VNPQEVAQRVFAILQQLRADQKDKIINQVTDSDAPLFSVLVPSYNQARYLPAALDSLLAQTYSNWEAVVINDGSTDDTAQVAASYADRDPRIRVFNQQNGGVAAALNTGLRQARGEWICWLSSDDLFESDKLEIHKNAIKEHPRVKFFHSAYSMLNNVTGRKETTRLNIGEDCGLQVLWFFSSCWVHGNSWAANRSIFQEMGWFNESDYRNAQDFEMWLRISLKHPLKYIDMPTCVSRVHSGQETFRFPEAGLFDCVKACVDLLNTHRFPELFPFLDITKEAHAKRAIAAVFGIYQTNSSYYNQPCYNSALLARLFEWLTSECPYENRASLLHCAKEHLSSIFQSSCPDSLKKLFGNFFKGDTQTFEYEPQSYYQEIGVHANNLIQRGRLSETKVMTKYLIERGYLNQQPKVIPPKKPTQKLRILLISPPYARFLGLGNCRFPLSFGALGTMLSMNGHAVAIYDADFDRDLIGKTDTYEYTFSNQHKIQAALQDRDHFVWKEIDRTIQKFNPDVIGITTMTSKYPMALRMAEMAKSINRDIRVVIGGHHSSIFGPKLVQDANIDFAVIGEGEMTFLELINQLCDPRPDFSRINGLIYKEGARIVTNNPRELLSNLDVLPIADRELMINEGYVSENNIMASRGCPFNCSYCGAHVIWKRRVRRRSVPNIIREIEYLFQRGPSRNVNFWDDTFTGDRRYVVELMTALKKFNGLTFSCITRLDVIDRETLDQLKAAGCSVILFGIESGSNEILRKIDKKMTSEMIQQKTELVNAAGIPWLGFFIMGYPGETKEQVLETLAFMKNLDPSYAEINIFNPLPGTKIWDELEAQGLVSSDLDFSQHSQSSTENFFTGGSMTRQEFKDLALFMAKEFDAHNRSHNGK
jgi:radical SAM superfamily enzyme YgiQ (UPF0313 family)/glycosyltransferase involved in cell wall biosynthesis